MGVAIGLIAGVIVAWVAVDRWLTWRRDRGLDGSVGASEFGPGRVFHSTGWEETVPPALGQEGDGQTGR